MGFDVGECVCGKVGKGEKEDFSVFRRVISYLSSLRCVCLFM
jgi:hypothetical protein